MGEDRFIEVKTEIKVAIDRRLVEELGIPEDEVRRFVENRLSSLTHRLSMWITETIASSMMLSLARPEKKQAEKKQAAEQDDTVIVAEDSGSIYIVPSGTYRMYPGAKKYLRYKDRLIPLKLTKKHRVRNREAIDILYGLLGEQGRLRLRIVKANKNSMILAPEDD